MGVHSRLPYLYPMYGPADITQVFSRISAVYGGAFILDKKLTIDQIRIDSPIEIEESKQPQIDIMEETKDTEANDTQEAEQNITKEETCQKEKNQSGAEKEDNVIQEDKEDKEVQENTESIEDTETKEVKETKEIQENTETKVDPDPASLPKDKKHNNTKPEKKSSPVTKPNQLYLSSGEENILIGFDKLLVGAEFHQICRTLLNQKTENIKSCVFHTIHFVFKCDLSIDSDKIPFIVIYPEHTPGLKNQNLMRANVLGWNSKNTLVNYVYANLSFEKYENVDYSHLREKIRSDIESVVSRKLTDEYWFRNDRVYR